MKRFLSILLAMVVILSACVEKQSPYVKGMVVKKQYVKGHFDNQKTIIVEEAGLFCFPINPSRGGSRSSSRSSSKSSSKSSSRSSSKSSSKSSSRSSSKSSNISSKKGSSSGSKITRAKKNTNRFSRTKAFKPKPVTKITNVTHVTKVTKVTNVNSSSHNYYNRSDLYSVAPSGRYYTPYMGYNDYHHYQHYYNYSSGNTLLLYILLYQNMNDENETPTKYYLPEYKICVMDSTKHSEWVKVDSLMYAKVKKGDMVNFKRYQVAEYEDEDDNGNW